VIDTSREVTGRTIRTDVGPRRAGDLAVLVAGSDKIRKELGWSRDFRMFAKSSKVHGDGTKPILTVI
jgi:UDP-glucose 4-epimerase